MAYEFLIDTVCVKFFTHTHSVALFRFETKINLTSQLDSVTQFIDWSTQAKIEKLNSCLKLLFLNRFVLYYCYQQIFRALIA